MSSARKCIEMPTRVKTEIFMFLKPHIKAPPCAKTRVLTYCSSKKRSTGLTKALSRGTQKMATAAILDFPFLFLSTLHFWGSALDSVWQISWWSDSRFKRYYPGSIFVFHRKCIESAHKFGVLAILGVKTEIFIFLNPKRQLHVPKHAFWRITRRNRSTGLTRALSQGTNKIMVLAAILDFQIFVFWAYYTFGGLS